MAKSSLIDSAEITEVYYRMGKFTNDQRERFVKAPFDLVKIDGEEYIQPLAVGGDDNALQTYLTATPVTSDEYYLGRRDFGYVNGNPLVLNENQVGNQSDTAIGLFSIGMI